MLSAESVCVFKIQEHTFWAHTATNKISQRVLHYGVQRPTVAKAYSCKGVVYSLLIVTVDCSGNLFHGPMVYNIVLYKMSIQGLKIRSDP